MKNVFARLKKSLQHNWGLKLSSVFLAFVIWFIVTMVGDPQDTRPYSNIQVRLVNTELLENQNKVYEVLDNTDIVRVRVTAPTSVFQSLRAGDIIAEADVSKLTDINTIAITYYVQNANLDVVSFEGDHNAVRLNVEDRASKWIRVAYQTVGEVAEGYVVGNITTDQTSINISGGESAVRQVESAYAELNVEGATNNISANVNIYLRDAEGNRINLDKIEKSAEQLHLTAEILATKVVPVETELSGQPADGYMVVGEKQQSLETVLIAGTLANLAGVSKIQVPETKLDLTGLTDDKTFTVNLKDFLPNNIRLAESDFNGKMTVEVRIKQSRERTLTISAQNISFQNVPAEFEIRPVEDEDGQPLPVQMKVKGLRESVSALHPSNITGTVDIAEWMTNQEISQLVPGIYEIPVTFEMGQYITILENGTIKVQIIPRENPER